MSSVLRAPDSTIMGFMHDERERYRCGRALPPQVVLYFAMAGVYNRSLADAVRGRQANGRGEADGCPDGGRKPGSRLSLSQEWRAGRETKTVQSLVFEHYYA